MATGQEMVVHEGGGQLAPRDGWGGAAQRGLEARQAREAIIAQVLKADIDYGTIPGTNKPTLLKGGAEKIADSLSLYPDYEEVRRVEDWDRPLFHVAYRCILRQRGSEAIVATGIGSCNSMESRYRWRDGKRTCPSCGQAAIRKSKYPPRNDPNGEPGWYCHEKAGGCGAQFDAGDGKITSQEIGRVENDDVFSIVNTIDKMAQKRALVAATLNLGFSEQFTQDLEDGVGDAEGTSSGTRQQQQKPGNGGVQMPRRASQGKPAPQGQAPAQAAAQQGAGGQLRAVILGLSHKSGETVDQKTKKPKPWTLYTLDLGEAGKMQTFDKGLADVAAAFAGSGEALLLDFETTDRGRRVTGITADEPGLQPEA